jgi:hypothetical protein
MPIAQRTFNNPGIGLEFIFANTAFMETKTALSSKSDPPRHQTDSGGGGTRTLNVPGGQKQAQTQGGIKKLVPQLVTHVISSVDKANLKVKKFTQSLLDRSVPQPKKSETTSRLPPVAPVAVQIGVGLVNAGANVATAYLKNQVADATATLAPPSTETPDPRRTQMLRKEEPSLKMAVKPLQTLSSLGEKSSKDVKHGVQRHQQQHNFKGRQSENGLSGQVEKVATAVGGAVILGATLRRLTKIKTLNIETPKLSRVSDSSPTRRFSPVQPMPQGRVRDLITVPKATDALRIAKEVSSSEGQLSNQHSNAIEQIERLTKEIEAKRNRSTRMNIDDPKIGRLEKMRQKVVHQVNAVYEGDTAPYTVDGKLKPVHPTIVRAIGESSNWVGEKPSKEFMKKIAARPALAHKLDALLNKGRLKINVNGAYPNAGYYDSEEKEIYLKQNTISGLKHEVQHVLDGGIERAVRTNGLDIERLERLNASSTLGEPIYPKPRMSQKQWLKKLEVLASAPENDRRAQHLLITSQPGGPAYPMNVPTAKEFKVLKDEWRKILGVLPHAAETDPNRLVGKALVEGAIKREVLPHLAEYDDALEGFAKLRKIPVHALTNNDLEDFAKCTKATINLSHEVGADQIKLAARTMRDYSGGHVNKKQLYDAIHVLTNSVEANSSHRKYVWKYYWQHFDENMPVPQYHHSDTLPEIPKNIKRLPLADPLPS